MVFIMMMNNERSDEYEVYTVKVNSEKSKKVVFIYKLMVGLQFWYTD